MEERRNTHPQGADHSRKRRKVRPGHVAGGVVMTVFTLVLIGVCTTLMLLGIFMKYVNTSLLPTLEVRAEDYTMSQSSVVYYQDKESGQWVEFQKVHGQENRVLIDIDDMSPYLWQAAVSIEDERFFSHHGVDWKRTLGATLLTLTGSNDSYGGSTITQQMLKNMTGENQNTINRKVKEIFRALEFEKNNTKSQILELYLNMIYLGSGCGGVETAAEYYFGKSAKDLTAAESACIIAITNNPSLYNPKYERTYTRKDGTTVTVALGEDPQDPVLCVTDLLACLPDLIDQAAAAYILVNDHSQVTGNCVILGDRFVAQTFRHMGSKCREVDLTEIDLVVCLAVFREL